MWNACLINAVQIVPTSGLFLTGGYGPFLSFCSWTNRTCWLKKSWQGNLKLKITFLNMWITLYLRMVSFFSCWNLRSRYNPCFQQMPQSSQILELTSGAPLWRDMAHAPVHTKEKLTFRKAFSFIWVINSDVQMLLQWYVKQQQLDKVPDTGIVKHPCSAFKQVPVLAGSRRSCLWERTHSKHAILGCTLHCIQQ